MGKGTYPNDVYILEKQATSTGSIVNTKVATTMPIRIAVTTTSQVTYKVVYYGNDTSEAINLGTLTDENNRINSDLSKITNDFIGKSEYEFFNIIDESNEYKSICELSDDSGTHYYIQYNGKRYIITFNWDEIGYFISDVEEYKNPLKDVTYAITNDIDIYQGDTKDVHDYIENMYELEDMEYISNDENIATIDSSGIIRGISIGETTITLKGANTGKTKELNVTVSKSPLE